MKDFFLKLGFIHPKSIAEILQHPERIPKNGLIWEFENDIKPIDLYCYLYAKFGRPNGIQSFLRKDDSDNLIHWEWTLSCNEGLVMIQGHNFRTEVHLMGEFNNLGLTLECFISQIKSDMGNYGKKISTLRKDLEKWTQFINPYHRIESVVSSHIKILEELELDPLKDKVTHPKNQAQLDNYEENWKAATDKYSYAIGIIFGLRAMLPVLAESFINFILFVLSKQDIKNNTRLFDSTVRQPIDIRVQSLHINCTGFNQPVDYSSDECKKFHTLMNERNDLLHGNVNINKLSIGEVHFDEKVPLFHQYEDFWEKSVGVSLKSVKSDTIFDDYKSITNFIDYILSKLDEGIKPQIQHMLERKELGMNYKTGRMGVLFPDHMVDFRGLKK